MRLFEVEDSVLTPFLRGVMAGRLTGKRLNGFIFGSMSPFNHRMVYYGFKTEFLPNEITLVGRLCLNISTVREFAGDRTTCTWSITNLFTYPVPQAFTLDMDRSTFVTEPQSPYDQMSKFKNFLGETRDRIIARYNVSLGN